jgi:hypothetical protein
VDVFVAPWPQARQDLAQRAIAVLVTTGTQPLRTQRLPSKCPALMRSCCCTRTLAFLCHVLPGGVFEMGLTDKDFAAFRRAVKGARPPTGSSRRPKLHTP